MNLTGSVNVTTGAVTKGMESLFFKSQLSIMLCMKDTHACCFFIDQTVVISASVGSVLGILLMVMVALFILWIRWKMRQRRKQLKVIREVCSYT